MGSTEWIYFTRYQQNFEDALQELRREVFYRGAYQFSIGNMSLTGPFSVEDEPDARVQAIAAEVREQVGTIDRLLELAGWDGTHSILDILHVGHVPDYEMQTIIIPATSDDLMRWFGTARPTRQQAEGVLQKFDAEFPQCFHVFDHDLPAGICFVGASGD